MSIFLHLLSVCGSLTALCSAVVLTQLSPPARSPLRVLIALLCLAVLYFEYAGRPVLELAVLSGTWVLKHDLCYDEHWLEPTIWARYPRRSWLVALCNSIVLATLARWCSHVQSLFSMGVLGWVARGSPVLDLVSVAAALTALHILGTERTPDTHAWNGSLEKYILALGAVAPLRGCLLAASPTDMLIGACTVPCGAYIQVWLLPRWHAEYQLRCARWALLPTQRRPSTRSIMCSGITQPLQVRQRPSKRACYSICSVLGGQLNALSRPIQRMISHKKGVAFQHFSAGATEKSSGWDFSFYGSDGLFSL
jgi:hypothetical protein